MAVVATLSKSYDLDYIWKQVDRGPVKDAASYYIQASESGGEPPGRWWGPGAKALGFEPGQRVEREPYDLLFGERKAPDGTQLGRPPGNGRKAADLYAQLLAAEPHATAERRRELRIEATRQARQSPLFFDLTVSLSKSISLFHASLGENARLARRAGDHDGDQYWSALVGEVDDMIWQALHAGFGYFQREAGYTRTGSHNTRVHGRETGQWREADLAVAHWLQHTSRDGDMQLHVHSQIAHVARTATDEKWRAPDSNTASQGQIERLPARKGWPRGATSDDTALTMLVARHLADRDGDGDPAVFLADLAQQEPTIRGLGPTTTAAIERFRRGGEVGASPGRATNGAAMRALPIGWVLFHDQAERRRQVTIAMSRATHADPAALVAACVIAACASWALEGASPSMLLEAAIEEAREAAQEVRTDACLAEMLTRVSAGTWEPPAKGISLDPYETVAAGAVVRDKGNASAQRAGERGTTRRRYRYRRRTGGWADGRQVDRRAGTRRAAMASAGRLARIGDRDSGDRRRSGNYPCDSVSVRSSRQVLRGYSPSAPNVTPGEPRSLE